VGLITRKDIATSKLQTYKPREITKTHFHGCFPPLLSLPYKNGLVTKEKMASPLEGMQFTLLPLAQRQQQPSCFFPTGLKG
jgi:hypothetical protein